MKSDRTYEIAVVPGDGIGQETVPAAVDVLEAVAKQHGFVLKWDFRPWSAERFLETYQMIPDGGLDDIRSCAAILFGAHGAPGVPDHLAASQLLFAMRHAFDQYVNLRPVRTQLGVEPSIRLGEGEPIDLVIVRENREGEFAGPGGISGAGTPVEMATQMTIFTRYGSERIARYAFDLARTRRKRVTTITKSNSMPHAFGYWDRIVSEVAASYPDVEHETLYVDAAAADFVRRPQYFDVVLGTTLFGDILSDLGGALVGGLGLAPSGNINPERTQPSLFEPIHGSAPDIADKGIANPTATILAGAMMLDHIGEAHAGSDIRSAVDTVLSKGQARTRDLGGGADTREFAEAVVRALASGHGTGMFE
jgi:tartrate dehydrogenase/decarboxylase/D-malate dehydrogenase